MPTEKFLDGLGFGTEHRPGAASVVEFNAGPGMVVLTLIEST